MLMKNIYFMGNIFKNEQREKQTKKSQLFFHYFLKDSNVWYLFDSSSAETKT